MWCISCNSNKHTGHCFVIQDMSVVRKACPKKGEVAKSLANSIEFFSDEKREKNRNKVGHYPVLSAC